MAATGTSSVKTHRNTRHLADALTSAACEWFLIFLLFIDAALSYFLTKFAHYCGLQNPCPLCTRLEKPQNYQSLLCRKHRSETSPLTSCHPHGKLADCPGISSNDLQKFLHSNSTGSGTKPNLSSGVGSKMEGDELYGSTGPHHQDLLSHVGYTELKLNSDSESDSEVPFSDGNDSNVVRERIGIKENVVKFVSESSPTNDLVPKNVNNHLPSSTPSLGNGLEELDWHQPDQKLNPLVIPDLISIDNDDQSPSYLLQVHHPGPHSSDPSGVSELATPDDFSSLSHVSKLHVESCTKKSDAFINTGNVHFVHEENRKSAVTGKANGYKNDELLDDLPSSNPECSEASDALKPPLDGKKREVLTSITEEPSEKNTYQTVDNAALLFSCTPAAERTESPPNGAHKPNGVHNRDNRFQTAGASNELESVQSLTSTEERDSGLESSKAGTVVNETEGESLVDKLKRQIEYDQKCISDLHQELEEERNASAISANQAMAMINKLQEEKASLHMEALQYLRMMEEQAEHDVEELERSNDLLAEKEREVQDLEAELEFFRDNPKMSSISLDLTSTRDRIGSDEPSIAVSPLLDFEDEKLYLSEHLNKLKMKLDILSEDGIQAVHRIEENGSMEQELHASEGGSRAKEESVSSTHPTEIDLIAIEYEISDLNDRLEALEVDRDFLEHALNTMTNGAEGLQYIQDIAHQLQGLRKNVVRQKC